MPWFVILLLMLIFNGVFPAGLASKSKTITINPTVSGVIRNTGENYTEAWQANEGDKLYTTSGGYGSITTGHFLSDSTYYIYRGFMQFDTGFLNSFDVVRDVTLEIQVSEAHGDWTPNTQLWNCHVGAELELTDYSGCESANFAFNNAEIEGDSLRVSIKSGLIRKAGFTGLCLRLAHEVEGEPPTDSDGDQLIYFIACGSIKLTITYFEGSKAGDPPENKGKNPWSPADYFIAGGISFLSFTSCSNGDGNR